MLTAHFIREWDEGIDSFAKNPPNATVSVLGSEGDKVEDAVVVLKSPKLDGDTLSFDVDVLEGELKDADGAAALFIDHAVHGVGPRGHHFSAAGSVHPWRGAWYGRPYAYGAAGLGVGLAAGAALPGLLRQATYRPEQGGLPREVCLERFASIGLLRPHCGCEVEPPMRARPAAMRARRAAPTTSNHDKCTATQVRPFTE